MALYKYLFSLIFFISPQCLGSKEIAYWEEEGQAYPLIAAEDLYKFQREVGSLGKDYGEKWMALADGDGRSVVALMDHKSHLLKGNKKTIPDLTNKNIADKVKLYLYCSKNKDKVQFNTNNLGQITFNSSNPSRIIIHGWMADSNSSVTSSIKDAYLNQSDSNIIAVDWSGFSKNIFYPSAVSAAYPIGKYIGAVIDDLVHTHKARHADFHLIGHSLGAHIAGFAGNSTKEKVGRITGLDPALPGFQYMADRTGRLDDSDANFVDVIHTCSGLLGISIPIGHVDFYPNGGSPFQPGCDMSPIPTDAQACSHSRSHEFFSESISKQSEFYAIKCKNWENFKNHHCEEVYALMGEYVSRDTRGIFYLKTNDEPLFGKGPDGIIF